MAFIICFCKHQSFYQTTSENRTQSLTIKLKWSIFLWKFLCINFIFFLIKILRFRLKFEAQQNDANSFWKQAKFCHQTFNSCRKKLLSEYNRIMDRRRSLSVPSFYKIVFFVVWNASKRQAEYIILYKNLNTLPVEVLFLIAILIMYKIAGKKRNRQSIIFSLYWA